MDTCPMMAGGHFPGILLEADRACSECMAWYIPSGNLVLTCFFLNNLSEGGKYG